MAGKTLPPPNLEIMKLAEYYKREENKFCRIIDLEETELSSYEKIYAFSENDQCINMPDAFLRASNVIYGGSAFTNKKYIPFENELIDYTIPRANIYSRLLKDKYAAGESEKVINHIIEDSYYRRFCGEKELPLPPINRKKRVYIYDRDFFQPGWERIIENITKHSPSSINFIHPMHFQHLSDFFTTRENTIISKSNDTFLDLHIPLKETKYMMQKYKTRLLSVILPSSAIYLSLGGSYYYQMDYYKNFIYKLNLLYEFWANKIPIKIKYEMPSLGCYDPLQELSQVAASWTRTEAHKEKTLMEKMPKKTKVESLQIAHEQVKKLIERFPQQKKLFQQTSATLEQGGKWIK